MVTRRDPLAGWFAHEVILERLRGRGAYGPVYHPRYTALAAIDSTARMVRDAEGAEVVSSTTVILPAGNGYIEPGSRLTLPGTHGARETTVIACQVAAGGVAATPDHVALNCE